ncbi:RelA/SpoT protein [Nakamurella silvestris]|nr:RelA/SpoT protein [Nakamurella silvestris]
MSTDSELEDLVSRMYVEYEKRWNYALRRTRRLLQALTTEILVGRDRERLVVQKGRIKEPASTVGKLRRKVAEGEPIPRTEEDVFHLVNDFVGIRILCKTPRDLDEISARLPGYVEAEPDVTLYLGESNDYVAHPKKSGYRARHFVLGISDPAADAVPDAPPTKVEVQIRTRLQDAWSELTHEDLYKPGPLKPDDFHDKIARTMAGLLNEVDALADHLATELDSGTDPMKPAEPAAAEAVDAEPTPVYATAVVVRSGPNYALAQVNGRQGLVPASVVRLLVGAEKLIDVDDYLQDEDVITVQIVESEKGVYYHPVDASQLRQPVKRPRPVEPD